MSIIISTEQHWNAYCSFQLAAKFELSGAFFGHIITPGNDQQTFIYILTRKLTRPKYWFPGKTNFANLFFTLKLKMVKIALFGWRSKILSEANF
jgi:hypothetical protein